MAASRRATKRGKEEATKRQRYEWRLRIESRDGSSDSLDSSIAARLKAI
jgi:hypothetical protein